MPAARHRSSRRPALLAGVATALAAVATAVGAPPVLGQSLAGMVRDAHSGAPVQAAGIYLVDAGGERRGVAMSDSLGRFRIDLPTSGEHALVAERFGYEAVRSPLFTVGDTDLDAVTISLEMEPRPLELAELSVTVRNEQLTDWFSLRWGQNPAVFPGYRLIQGLRLEEARIRSEDNTELLRWLYIPVSHGREVCLGSPMPALERGGGRVASGGAGVRLAGTRCGKLFVDGEPMPAEHLDRIDMRSIGAVVFFDTPLSVYLFTRGFDWTSARGR